MAQVDGSVDPKFARVADALASCQADGVMQGGSVAVVIAGKVVAELWCGHADAAATRPWARDTLVNVWSCTKGVMAAAIAMAVDRKLLRYDAPLAAVWPEFATNGKEQITLDHVMSHRSGLNGFPDPMPDDIFVDWTTTIRALEIMTPVSTPGSVCAYHALTYGHLTGEALHRVTGKSVGAFIREHIIAPLGVEFHVGVPASDDDRCAEMIEGPKASNWVATVLASPYPQSCQNPTPNANAPNTRAWRAAEIPGGNGHCNALALAAIYGDLTKAQPTLLSADAVREASRIRFKGIDESFASETCWGAGFRVGRTDEAPHLSANAIGHGGWGGSIAFGDPEAQLGFAFVTNTMLGFDDGIDPRRQRLIKAVYDSL
jgi:CubicO group peptidase (beta-lactamase class C family)